MIRPATYFFFEEIDGNTYRFLIVSLGLFILVHSIMFRDILFSLPDIITGNAAITRTELIPFFNVHTQFLDQIFGQISPLTSTSEIRVAYSFWASWVRFNPILPFAFIFMNALAASLVWLSTLVFVNTFKLRLTHSDYIITGVVSFMIFFIELYAQITQFYTLVLGFALFALVLSYTIRALIKGDFSPRTVLQVSALVLFNPAIHFHMLYYLTTILTLVMIIVLQALSRDSSMRDVLDIKSISLFLLAVYVISIIPYGAFIAFIITHSEISVASTIPVNYLEIAHNSLSLLHVFSLDLTSQVTYYLHGSYLPLLPQYSKMIITAFFFILSFGVLFKSSILPKRERVMVAALVIVVITAFWIALGYSTEWSFYALIRDVMLQLSGHNNYFVHILKELVYTVFQTLRFPHRFLLSAHVYIMFIVALGAVFMPLNIVRKQIITTILVITFCGISILGVTDYRDAILSGDFNGFLKPYIISDDLSNIRLILEADNNKNALLFILPSFESGRETKETAFSFLDKLPIYYLNTPTFYYGSGANPSNKLRAFMIYRGLLYKQGWWEDLVADNIQATHILVPSLQNSTAGHTFAPQLEDILDDELEESRRYKLVYKGDDYSLYEQRYEKFVEVSKHIMLAEADWGRVLGQLNLIENENTPRIIYFPSQYKEFLQAKGLKYTYSESMESIMYDVIGNKHPEWKSVVDHTMFPFMKDPLVSTAYLNTPFSAFPLLGSNNHYGVAIPSIAMLVESIFTGSNGNGKIVTNITVPKSGDYRIILRGYIDSSNPVILINDKPINVDVVERKGTYASFLHYTADVYLKEGSTKIELFSNENKVILYESILIIPSQSLPEMDNNQILWDEYAIKSIGVHQYQIVDSI